MIRGLFLIVLIFLILAGCGQNSSSSNQAVTVKIGLNPTLSSEEDLQLYILDPVQKKYPHITVEPIIMYRQGTSPQDLITAGNIPDVFIDFPHFLTNLRGFGLDENMDALIKKHKVDLGKIQPEYLETIKKIMEVDYLTGLPLVNNAFALFYNVDLFNRFGVDPPKDHMTWEEIRALAVKMNRMEEGTQYYGLYPDLIYRGADQVSVPYLDLKNHQAVFQSDPRWKSVFDLWLSLYHYPGAETMPDSLLRDDGYRTGQIAMYSGYSLMLSEMARSTEFEWDVVTYPTNTLSPGVGQIVDALVMSVARQSKEKDAAMQVISVMISDEVQTYFSRNSQVSVLKSEQVHAEFGKATPELASKNVIAFTKNKLAVIHPFGYVPVGPAITIPISAFNEVRQGLKDVNTALREADEKMNQLIEAERFKKE